MRTFRVADRVGERIWNRAQSGDRTWALDQVWDLVWDRTGSWVDGRDWPLCRDLLGALLEETEP